jgi:iron complex outermembrane recepter protein
MMLVLACTSGAAFAAEASAPAAAPVTATNDSDSNDSGDIVISAQRREQNLQVVPLAVSAFGETALKAGKVDNLTDLTGRVPNVVLAPVGAYPAAGAFAIRGIGFSDVESTFEPAVGVEVDGVYIARNVGFLQDFFDVESVTILRGPQGTLYGRNTIGGVVSVQSKRPTGDFGVRGEVTAGSYGRRELRGAVEGPIVDDVLLAKVSMIKTYGEGYYHNDDGRTFNKTDDFSVRGTLVYKPTSTFDATLIIDHSALRDTGPALENASLPFMVLSKAGYPADSDGLPYDTHTGSAIMSNLDATGETLEANWDLGPVKLTSITGGRQTHTVALSDYDGEHVKFLDVGRDETHNQFSQELRVASAGPGPLHYVVGAFYMHQRYDIAISEFGTAFGAPNAGSYIYAGQTTQSLAAFGQLDYDIGNLTLTAGGRYSHDYKNFNIQPLFFATSQTFDDSFDDFSPKFAASYQFTPEIMGYAQYSRGFRSGGFNGRAGSFASVGPYGSEHVNSYEAGLKTQFLDRKVTLNLAAFTSQYGDMQQGVQSLIPGTNINQTIVANAASARISGFEAETTLHPGGGFTITGSLGYLDAHFNDFVANLGDGQGTVDHSNLPLTYAPKWSGSVTGNYRLDLSAGTLNANVTVRSMSDMYTGFTTLNTTSDLTVRQANTLVDGAIRFETADGHWNMGVWGKNLTNQVVINNTFTVGSLLADRVYEAPREIGVDLGFKF